MGEFRDHPLKKVIRERWCRPLIKFIHDTLQYKFVYLGLPGPLALDLLNWLEYIDEVIAFQCRDYPKPSSIGQPRDKVLELEEKLREFERQRKLSTFSVYDGYIEEVILRGRDTNGNEFKQDDIVTIYNLDFCNGITVPLAVKDDKGNIQKLYKSEAIRKLLELQKDVSSLRRSKKFVMFLTIHSNFWDEEAKRFVAQTQEVELQNYINSLSKLHGWHKSVRLLKVYIYDIIKNFFCRCDFTPEFSPVIYYKGAGKNNENWLMLFTVIGALNKQISSIAPCLQNSQGFLNQKFLTIKKNKLSLMAIPGRSEADGPQESVASFQNSECYKQLWLIKK